MDLTVRFRYLGRCRLAQLAMLICAFIGFCGLLLIVLGIVILHNNTFLSLLSGRVYNERTLSTLLWVTGFMIMASSVIGMIVSHYTVHGDINYGPGRNQIPMMVFVIISLLFTLFLFATTIAVAQQGLYLDQSLQKGEVTLL